MLANLNDSEIRKIFKKWISNSKYEFDVDVLINSVATINYEMSSTEYYNALKKLGYKYERYAKLKDKNFYREVSYKKFINKAINHLMYELEQEEKQIIEDLQYELEGF